MYAHIIREDGTFVIRDKDIEYADYQGYVRALYADDTEAVDLYIEDLLMTLKEGRDYFAILEFGGGRLHGDHGGAAQFRMESGHCTAFWRSE